MAQRIDRRSTRPTSHKGKNLAHNPHCVITFATDALDEVVEGEAVKVTGDAKLNRVADAFASKYEWHFAVRDGVVYDESLPGPPVYGFYEVNLTRAFGYGADGHTLALLVSSSIHQAEEKTMALPKTASRVAWLAARKEDR